MQLKNFLMLVFSFCIGQGSIFLVQTWLLTSNEMVLLANFGFNFSFFILGITIVESGSIIIISRHVLNTVKDTEFTSEVSKIYWNVTAFRVCLAIIIIIMTFIYMSFFVNEKEFAYSYYMAALPAFLFWAFSFSGVLDGLKLSGFSGITGSIGYTVSAISLIYVKDISDVSYSGFILGASLTVSYIIAIILQIVILKYSRFHLLFKKPERNLVLNTSKDCIAMLAGLLPGQLYQRAQLAICNSYLGVDVTAIYLYAKQIINSGSLLVGFVRRVEFYLIVDAVNKRNKSILDLIIVQKKSLSATILLFICMLLLASVFDKYIPNVSSAVTVTLLWISLTLLTESVGTSFMQLLYSAALFMKVGTIRLLAVIIGVVFSLLLTPLLGIKGLVFSDMVVHFVVTVCGIFFLRSRGNK